MLTFDAGAVVRASSILKDLERDARDFIKKEPEKKTTVIDRVGAKSIRENYLDVLVESISGLNAKATSLAVSELRTHLTAHKLTLRYDVLAELISDIRVTLRRELSLTKMLCIEPSKESYFDVDFSTFGNAFETSFAFAVYEIDEAGKCHALSRSTACVFHLMRAMEIGIRAMARCLNIPDPTKGADRNWGRILEKIKSERDRRDAAKPPQWNKDDKQFFAESYASLDAVRVAWRNTTMHVENKYTDDESEHIFVAVRGLMKKLSSRMDEQGQPLA